MIDYRVSAQADMITVMLQLRGSFDGRAFAHTRARFDKTDSILTMCT